MSERKSRPLVIVVVLIVGVFAGAGATLLVLLMPAGVPPYMSTCVIKASRDEVVTIYTGERPRLPSPDIKVVRERMLRYDAVITALADTDLMSEVESRSAGKPELRDRLEGELYKRVVRNTKVKPLGDVLIRVTYRDDTPHRAFTVLQKIVNHFVENALSRERTIVRRAREMALADFTRAADMLESLESKLVTFDQDHPGVRGPDLQKKLEALVEKLSGLDTEIEQLRRQIIRCDEQLKAKPDAPRKQALMEKRADLDSDLTVMLETRRHFNLRKTELAEEARVLPGLRKERATLMRETRAAEERYETARKNFERVNDNFKMTMEGLVSFSIVRPPRMPTERNAGPNLLKRLLD